MRPFSSPATAGLLRSFPREDCGGLCLPLPSVEEFQLVQTGGRELDLRPCPCGRG